MAEKNEKQYVSDNAQLMAEWDWEKNTDFDPFDLTLGSHKKAWWRCKADHNWQASIAHRNNGRGCPYCAGKIVVEGVTDLKTVNPVLAQEWNYERNHGLSPENVFSCSNKKVWWKCAFGHEWQAAISHRNRDQGCPICSGKKILASFNDLAITHPSLVKEWDFEKNKDLLPTEISRGSEKKVWWKCNRGHSWNAVVYSRVSGVGCPYCAKELQASFPEKAIYFYVRRVFHDAIANYRPDQNNLLELDIFIPSLQIGIEYDGERWHQNLEKDLHKNEICAEIGIALIRIREPNCPILSDKRSICIFRESKKGGMERTINSLFEKISEIVKIDFFVDADLERDNTAILDLLTSLEKENSIYLQNTDLLDEWDYAKNGALLPSMVTPGSDKRVWWICKRGHSYQASISSRTRARGCPICSGKKVLKGYNDFESHYPELTKYWDYDKNIVTPDVVAYGSDKKFWWICDKGHSYECSINNRRAGQSCYYCSGKRVLAGFNDISTTHPDIAEQWCADLNDLQPTEVNAGSHKKVWWTCRFCGNNWLAPVYNRTSGHGCPKCARKRCKITK